MLCKTAVEQLLEASAENSYDKYSEDTKCFGLARVGSETQKIVSGTMKQFLEVDMGPPLHSFII